MRTPSNIKMQKTGAKVVFYAGGDGPLLILALDEQRGQESLLLKAALCGVPQIRNQPHPGFSSAPSLASISVSGRL